MVAYGSDERDNSGASSGAATLQDARAGRRRDTAAARLLHLNPLSSLRCVTVNAMETGGACSPNIPVTTGADDKKHVIIRRVECLLCISSCQLKRHDRASHFSPW